MPHLNTDAAEVGRGSNTYYANNDEEGAVADKTLIRQRFYSRIYTCVESPSTMPYTGSRAV